MINSMSQRMEEMFTKLLNHFGPQHWWPGETEMEVIVGTVLTQNTNWKNVEKAILNLKERGLLSPHQLNALSVSELAQLIQPAGYFNIKAKRLKNLIDLLREKYHLDLSRLLDEETDTLRQELIRFANDAINSNFITTLLVFCICVGVELL